jgi:5-methylcytosine-specific restriction enzyme A
MGWSYQKPKGWTATTQRILKRDNHSCYICGPHCTGFATQVDHVIPRSQGGSDHDSNLSAACKPCHDEKTKAETTAGKRRRTARPKPRHPGLIWHLGVGPGRAARRTPRCRRARFVQVWDLGPMDLFGWLPLAGGIPTGPPVRVGAGSAPGGRR